MEDFVLNWNQKRILKNVPFLKKYSFYLAGGTALALHFGHRTSIDLDFYSKEHFEGLKLVEEFRAFFKEDLSEPKISRDTLWLKIKNTGLSFFRYPYPLIRPLVSYQTVKLASLEDIIAMKIEAIITRGKKRDFVDVYFAIKKYGVKKILDFFRKKYPQAFNEYACITALTYFEDAEKTEQGRKRVYIYSGVSWRLIKKYIIEEVKKYQMGEIK